MDADEFRAGLHVLAVDGDNISLILLAKQLRCCQYNVTTVMDPDIALEILRARRDDADQFDLLITDVHMPKMDGFKLLELVSIEMNIPVIVLSANETLGVMMKSIQHGVCDYFVKPVRLEQLKTLWMHVVRKRMHYPSNCISKSDYDGHRLQSRDGEVENGENHNMECSRKKMKDGCGTREGRGNTSTSRRKRFQWSGEQHRKFVEVVNCIGMDKAVPKKILEMMNVEGLTREHVGSHLQKYRLFIKKLGSGTFERHGRFTDVWGQENSININGEHFKHKHGRYYQPSISFPSSSSSSNPFARRTNSSAAFGPHSSLPTQLVRSMMQKNLLSIPLKGGMGLVGYGGNMTQVAVPGSHQGPSNFTSGTSNTNIYFPSGPCGSSFANNISNGMPLNVSKTSPSNTSSMANSDLPPPFSNLPMQKPLESTAPFNGFSGSSHNSGKNVAVSKVLGHSCKGETSEAGSSQENRRKFDQLSRLTALSGQKSEFQNNMAALTRITAKPTAGFIEQVAPFNIGSNTDYNAMKSNMSAPGGEGGIDEQQVVSDPLNNKNEFLGALSTAQNGTNDDVLDEFFGDWLNQGVLKNDGTLMNEDWEFPS